MCDENKGKASLWHTILCESEQIEHEFQEELVNSSSSECPTPQRSSDYLNAEIFPFLLPAMEEMLLHAKHRNALRIQKCAFNGLDYLAEALWNRNPRYSMRSRKWLQALDIPRFKLLLRQYPRPIFPKSWIWTDEEAALYLQRHIRGWLIRKRDDVQEMRQFWKAIRKEDKVSICSIAEITADPIKFAMD